MARYLSLFMMLMVVLSTLCFFSDHVEGGYRKPPLNGSIFGKRTSGVNPSLSLNSKGKFSLVFFFSLVLLVLIKNLSWKTFKKRVRDLLVIASLGNHEGLIFFLRPVSHCRLNCLHSSYSTRSLLFSHFSSSSSSFILLF